jgi:hypothetical protein
MLARNKGKRSAHKISAAGQCLPSGRVSASRSLDSNSLFTYLFQPPSLTSSARPIASVNVRRAPVSVSAISSVTRTTRRCMKTRRRSASMTVCDPETATLICVQEAEQRAGEERPSGSGSKRVSFGCACDKLAWSVTFRCLCTSRHTVSAHSCTRTNL